MVPLTEQAQRIVAEHVHTGEIVIDATSGNGHDTFFLSKLVGEQGKVFACDRQHVAIEATRIHCAVFSNIDYHQKDHVIFLSALLSDYARQIAAVMFNLGYLPGGDKSQTTHPATTISAIHTSLDLLREEGVLSVLAYVGHPGGFAEAAAVQDCLRQLCEAGKCEFLARPETPENTSKPQLFVVRKRLNRGETVHAVSAK